MSKGLRLTQKWMQRGLWLVAFAFAAFLIGLGGKVVENLWDVEQPLTVEQFLDPATHRQLTAAMELAQKRTETVTARREQAAQKLEVAKSNSRLAQETFSNWIATRQATMRPDQDPDLIARTRGLEAVKTVERSALAEVETQDQALLDTRQAGERASAQMDEALKPAQQALARAYQLKELRVFLYRLVLTLPLLLGAGWLFAKKRGSTYWPFVWGFIFFALFAFFVELVPYLPSYGGYVRYIAGIVLTVVAGRYAILSLQRYLARQKAAEAMPEVQRRETLNYDMVYTRLAKSVCPGCERPVDLKDPALDFCPHCGIGLFERCPQCKTRKGAFARFCFSCGTPGRASLPD